MSEAHTYQLANIKYPPEVREKTSECKLIVYIGFAIFNDPTQIRKSFFSLVGFTHIYSTH